MICGLSVFKIAHLAQGGSDLCELALLPPTLMMSIVMSIVSCPVSVCQMFGQRLRQACVLFRRT